MGRPATGQLNMNDPRRILAALACCVTVLSAAAAAPAAGSGAVEPAPRTEAVARCNWDRPGHNPFMGEVVPAVDRYADIPAPVRTRLKERIAARRYDEIVEIRRDSIRGRHDYRPEIRDMHFGLDRVCREVTRSAWTDAMRERGLVYCESGHCILVPTVCRNVSRIERIPARAVAGETIEAPGGDVPAAAAAAAPVGPPADLAADPTAVGAPMLLAGAPTFADGVADTIQTFAGPLVGGYGGGGGGYGGGGGPGNGGGFGSGGGADGDGSPGLGGPVFGSRGGDGDAGRGPNAGGIDGDPDGLVGVGGGGSQAPLPVSPVPEPSTWASLLAGLALVTAVNRARQRRAGAPRCATQKRS